MITRQILPHAHSYATRANAQKALDKALEGLKDSSNDNAYIRTGILAQADGRFTALVQVDDSSHYLIHYFIEKKCAVIG